ncbi:protein SIEVE ELEMENT OCCLUSION C-like [Canna indica]|uniref:Protein SIEVE ELEMENT OCCLUSION C-like n=1 Tax=Canna indica TaxID=4628 RepID=A0AAQ3QKS7_9LILI|nr:protein SIEVE ELEMENT OCCLUSION C-like [Canna indica]
MQSEGGSEYILPGYEDILMKKILQTHAPEDCQFDASLLLDLTENIFFNITMSSVLTAGTKSLKEAVREDKRSEQHAKTFNNFKELAMAVHHMSYEMIQQKSRDCPSNATTNVVLEALGKHQWSTKLAIVLAALASSYGNYCLVMEFCLTNPLALSLATIKGLRNSMKLTTMLTHGSKALMHLLEKMVGVTKCVMEFEILPLQYGSLDYEAMAMMKTQVHKASYWVIRSSVECASQITSMIASGFEQANVPLAAWELWSLAKKISYIYDGLRKKFNAFSQQIERKVHLRLLNLFEEVHVDNHDVLYTLFALKDDYPLRHSCSEEKVGVDVLRNKVVMLFISSLDIDAEKLLLTTQQLQNKSHTRSLETYEIVWVPIVLSEEVGKRPYSQILEIIPWYSITEPSKVSTSVTKFIQEVWHFQGDPMMVVLDSHGKVSSVDAFDMVAIWGSKAYPFTISRERQLWEEESWSMKLILGNIDPLLSYWMEEGKTVCLYGSNDLEWIRELTRRMKDITEDGILPELIFVGSNMHEQTRKTLARVMEEKLSRYMSHVNISIFWLRLESMRSSRLRLGYTIESDFITQEINSLLTFDARSRGWLIVSEGTSTEILKLLGNEVLESLSLVQSWGQRVRKLGILGALSKSLATPLTTEPCDYSIATPYTESLNGGVVICKKCKSRMEKHIMYLCGAQNFDQ